MKLDIYEIRRLAKKRSEVFELSLEAIQDGNIEEYDRLIKEGAAITAKIERRTRA